MTAKVRDWQCRNVQGLEIARESKLREAAKFLQSGLKPETVSYETETRVMRVS